MNMLKKLELVLDGGLFLLIVLLSDSEADMFRHLFTNFDLVIVMSALACFINTCFYTMVVTSLEKRLHKD